MRVCAYRLVSSDSLHGVCVCLLRRSVRNMNRDIKVKSSVTRHEERTAMNQLERVNTVRLADSSSFSSPFPFTRSLAPFVEPLPTRVVHLALSSFKESALCPCKDTMTAPDSDNAGAQSSVTQQEAEEWVDVENENDKMNVDDDTRSGKRGDGARNRDDGDVQGTVNSSCRVHPR
jgi:hypothetical protein